MNDTRQMLRSLAIERPQPATAPPPRQGRLLLTAAGTAFLTLLLGASAVLWFGPPFAAFSKASLVADAPAQTPQAAPAKAAAAEPRQASSLVASGYVVARRKSTVAAEVTGKVVDLLVDEGMVVEAGQLLAKLDDILAAKDFNLAQSRVEASKAAAGAIAADLRDAQRILNRTQTLAQKNFATEADLTKAQARSDVLQAQLEQANAQLKTSQVDAQRSEALLEKYQIRAPFNGIVVDRSAQPGEMISPLSAGGGFTRTGICTIVDMDSIEIEVDVNEASIGRLHAGTRVEAVLDAYPNWVIPGSVIAIVPTANREKATIKVRVGLDSKDGRVLPDMAVKVTFMDGDASASASAK